MNNHRKGNDIRAYRACLIFFLFLIALIPSAAADSMFRFNPEHKGVIDNGGIVPTNAKLWRFV